MFLPNILFINTLTEHFKRNYLADSQWYIEHVKSVVQMTQKMMLFFQQNQSNPFHVLGSKLPG